ncbi:MAG: HpcH/HpaI aldolase/citrate lyase family protein [Solibacillus sp.]|jgi:citrate lyase beta subunit|uniref:HpcH/HpaI aldolase/citrate lyase family protein n=1 Tax=Solibacillus sp. TaxID=1909654 RepID=UPI003314D320
MRFFDKEVLDGQNTLFYEAPRPFTKYTEIQRLRYCVGAALYMPATREMIAQEIITRKHPSLTTIVIDLEDALGDLQVEGGIDQLNKTIDTLSTALHEGTLLIEHLPLLFVRVRDVMQLQQIIQMLGERQHVLTGYVLPKFSQDNGRAFLELIEQQNKSGYKLYAMPILESPHFLLKEQRMDNLLAIRAILVEFEQYILNIRIGTTDFCGLLGVRRTISSTIYDIHPVRSCIEDILNIFLRDDSPYIISGSVWEYFSQQDDGTSSAFLGLLREIEMDRLNGLIGKTIIHPSHIEPVNAMYTVTHEEFIDAKRILQLSDGQLGVQKSEYGNKMNEMKPHFNWAKRILLRAEAFGVLQPNVQYMDLLQRKVLK